MQKGALGLDDARDLLEVMIIDAGDQYRVHLHQNAALDQHLQPFLLLRDEDLRRRAAAHAPVFPEDPRIDLRADIGIDAVDRDRHVLYVVLGQLVDMLGQSQAIGRYAELYIRRLLGETAERGEGPRRIGQRIAGAGNPQHRHLRDCRCHGERLLHRLFRRQQFGNHAGARLIRAVVLAVAVVALDVARRRHRRMHAREVVMRGLGVARMVLHLAPDFVGQRGGLVSARATA